MQTQTPFANLKLFYNWDAVPVMFDRIIMRRITGRDEATLRTLERREIDPLPSFKVGASVLYKKDEFLEWLDRQRPQGRTT